jgi:chromosome segregation ATPase
MIVTQEDKTMNDLEPSYNDLKTQNAELLSALTKLEKDIERLGIRYVGKVWGNARVKLSFGNLIDKNKALAEKIEELEQENQELKTQQAEPLANCTELHGAYDRVKSQNERLKGELELALSRIKELEQENQELKNQVETYEMQNAGEDW